MSNAEATRLAALMSDQVLLLNQGKPLEAFDRYFAQAVIMIANDTLFATGAQEGRSKQEPYINAAVSISGCITDVTIVADHKLCVFRNRSCFTTKDGNEHQINGLCWQRWDANKVVEERYYDGDKMQEHLSAGLLKDPTQLLNQAPLIN